MTDFPVRCGAAGFFRAAGVAAELKDGVAGAPGARLARRSLRQACLPVCKLHQRIFPQQPLEVFPLLPRDLRNCPTLLVFPVCLEERNISGLWQSGARIRNCRDVQNFLHALVLKGLQSSLQLRNLFPSSLV